MYQMFYHMRLSAIGWIEISIIFIDKLKQIHKANR